MIRKSADEKIIIFSTDKFGKFYRLLAYKYEDHMLGLFSEWNISKATFEIDKDILFLDIHVQLVNPQNKNILIIGIEQDLDAGLIIWEITENGSIEEKKYWRSYFMNKCVASKTNLNSLWTLEENGFLKAQHVTALIKE